MIKLIDILNEAKQVGVLYHFTRYLNLLDILKSNKLKASITTGYENVDFRGKNTNFEIKPHVSFTRSNVAKNPNVANSNYSKMQTREVSVGLEIDGDKLSTRYNIVPYSMFDNPKIKHPDAIFLFGTPAEFEERVYKDIDNLRQYILSILITIKIVESLDKEEIIDYINFLKKYNIPIKYFANREISEKEFLKALNHYFWRKQK